ncbi:TPA: hypothetical protein ACP32N_005112 [Pseudomonas aeruginosa]
MSITHRLYPFHPVTGDRLVGTLEMIPALVPREIYRDEGVTTIEDGTESQINWNAQEVATLNGQQVLVTEAGASCVQSEILWAVHDVERLEVKNARPATTCPSFNSLMFAYIVLHMTLKCTIGNLKAGYSEGQLDTLLGQLNPLFDVDRLFR